MKASTVRLIIIIAIIFIIVAIIFFIGIGTIDKDEYGLVTFIAGVLIREFQSIIAFYFKKLGDNDNDKNSFTTPGI